MRIPGFSSYVCIVMVYITLSYFHAFADVTVLLRWFLGHILMFFVPLIGHMLSLYKQQNVLDRNLNFFLVILKHVFRAFGMFFLRKYFLGYI